MDSTFIMWMAIFLSTLPARGATQTYRVTSDPSEISIHAPREGSDITLASI